MKCWQKFDISRPLVVIRVNDNFDGFITASHSINKSIHAFMDDYFPWQQCKYQQHLFMSLKNNIKNKPT